MELYSNLKVCAGDTSLYSRRHLGTAQPFVSGRVKILYRRSKDYFEAVSESLTLCGISVGDSAAKRKGFWVNKISDRGLGLCCNGLDVAFLCTSSIPTLKNRGKGKYREGIPDSTLSLKMK